MLQLKYLARMHSPFMPIWLPMPAARQLASKRPSSLSSNATSTSYASIALSLKLSANLWQTGAQNYFPVKGSTPVYIVQAFHMQQFQTYYK
jgi:hypothetical protein